MTLRETFRGCVADERVLDDEGSLDAFADDLTEEEPARPGVVLLPESKEEVQAIVRAAERYDECDPVNVGSGRGTSIRELAETIGEVVGFSGAIRWNPEKPDGQLRKVLDVSRMRTALGWTPPTDLREGLGKTVSWYLANKPEADLRQ